MSDTPHRSYSDHQNEPWQGPFPTGRSQYGNQNRHGYQQPQQPYPQQQPYQQQQPPHPHPQQQPDPALTYPWAPPPPPPAPAHRLPRHPALGHHSDLRLLRSAYRWQRRVATLTALGYFTLFLVLSAFAPSLMTGTLPGGFSTGLFLGLCQLPVTALALWLYEYTARRRVDPLAHRLRRQAESDQRPAPGPAGGNFR
ncbi:MULTISPECIES: DUF485 domain-containing protein [unclassified Streptomyces]|uniref:DUF485 domain-containing protein n=1 Tax=unclassified Streptomyces TaxID=2593676 RepID=UPI002B1E74BE|nr:MULTISPECIES: DUF485 domain-containing protein [unclassified Streptomyces]